MKHSHFYIFKKYIKICIFIYNKDLELNFSDDLCLFVKISEYGNETVTPKRKSRRNIIKNK